MPPDAVAGELRLSPAHAWQLLEEEVLGGFDVRQLADEHRRSFLRDVRDDRLIGGRIYDAHIAEIARLARAAVVVTDNLRHFTGLRRHGIDVLTASEFAARL